MSSQYADSGVMYRLVLQLYHVMYSTSYQKYGGKTYIRFAEYIAFQVALFIARNGSYVNYYMLKWGQLKELHAAIKLCSTTLVQGARTNFSVRSTTRVMRLFKLRPLSSKKKMEVVQHFLLTMRNRMLLYKFKIYHLNTVKVLFSLILQHKFEVTLSCTKPRLHAQSFAHAAHAFLKDIYIGAANGSSNVMFFTMDIPIELNDGMKILVSNKMMGWNQYSEINSFLQRSKNSNKNKNKNLETYLRETKIKTSN
ncbi:beta-galactosidase 16 [Quercus suber]|uniref:Beta-galactosidase 16 n=1 Tax=Quercus suber TaxID=58331 RepID=A0AAW0ME22_QUESU